jgi:hypothetical protein
MDEWFASEEFARAPIPRILAEVWRLGLSGSLYVKAGGGPRCLSFDRGALVLDPASFEEKDFLRYLLTTGETDLISLARVEDHAQKNDVPILRALVETPLIAPARVWSLLESYTREEALSLFEARDAEREFHVRSGPPARVLVGAIDIPGLVLEGARRIEDPAVLDAFLPADGETVRRIPFGSPGAVMLSLTERYVLGLLDPPKTLAEVCGASDVGRAETRRILFAFLCLGLAGTAGLKPKTGRLPSDLSLASMDKLLGLFNAKCSFIFKYISKEIGPVAFSVIEKAMEEVRGRLDPVLQGAALKPDGRLEPRSLLKVNANIVGDESRRSLLRSMDEVLVAEVLAVKRTLGPAHESALVRALEKIGEGA